MTHDTTPPAAGPAQPEARPGAPLDAPLHEHLRRHARAHPDKPAYLWYGTAVSYAELDRASDAFAARLATLGVRRGEPVVLYLGNCPQYVMAHVGIQKLGAIVCPCGPLSRAHELDYQLKDLGARVIVAAAGLMDVVEEVRAESSLEHVFTVHYTDLLPAEPALDLPAELQAELQAERTAPRHDAPGTEDFLATVRVDAEAPAVALDMDDTALMTYTSGTTGLPKGAMLSYRNALYKSAAAADCNGMRAGDVQLAIAPLYHIAGMVMGLNVTLYTGATCVLLHRFDAVAALQAIERHRVTWWYGIAPMNVAALQVPGVAAMDLTSLRINPVTSFGITFTEALANEWRGVAPNCRSFEASYGLSETHTVDTYMPADAVRWGTQGIAVPGNEICILDPETGAPVPTGELGEIVLRSAGVFKGYWRQPETTARTLRDGWVHTGDIGRLDADGYLTFTGRIKEMIKVSGYAVFPEEVETLLVKHPAVAQAAVIGVPHATKGEVVRAFIVRRPDAAVEAEELIAWARASMSSYKAPREVRFIDALPATGAGKVLRRLLKDIA